MVWLGLAVVVVALWFLFRYIAARSNRAADVRQSSSGSIDFTYLPTKFVIFDLETTGLDPKRDEIIEIGAIRINRDSNIHDTCQTLVKPTRKISREITRLNSISQEMVDRDGMAPEQAIREFLDFVQDLPLVSFNADFDMAFLRNLAGKHGIVVDNEASCVLKMARLAWPGRGSYKLIDLAKEGGLSLVGTHRALEDSGRALLVFAAAARVLGGTITTRKKKHAKETCETSARMRTYLRTSEIPNDFAERNLLGIEFERIGEIDKAIDCYEANVADGFTGSHPFDRLAIIFRRRRDTASEIAVLKRAIEVFSQESINKRWDATKNVQKYRQRLDRVSTRQAKRLSRAAERSVV